MQIYLFSVTIPSTWHNDRGIGVRGYVKTFPIVQSSPGTAKATAQIDHVSYLVFVSVLSAVLASVLSSSNNIFWKIMPTVSCSLSQSTCLRICRNYQMLSLYISWETSQYLRDICPNYLTMRKLPLFPILPILYNYSSDHIFAKYQQFFCYWSVLLWLNLRLDVFILYRLMLRK